jgi:hypothetical protein
MRVLVRFVLGAAMLVAVAVAGVAVANLGPADATAWATVAAALAVVAAVASGWTGQRVLELQEDAQEPNPVPVIDLRSRYQLAQFRITNHGGTSAHDVRIAWQQQLRDAEGNDVLLGRDVAIPVIPHGDSASVLLGGSDAFMRAHTDTTCRGTVSFTNGSGRRYSRVFAVSAEHERTALVHDEEGPRTHWELQRIPGELERIRREVAGLVRLLERSGSASPSNNE